MSLTSAAVLLIHNQFSNNNKNEAIPFITNELNNLNFTLNKVVLLNSPTASELSWEINQIKKYNDILIIITCCETEKIVYDALSKLFSQDLTAKKENERGKATEIPSHAKLLTNCNLHAIVHMQQIFIVNYKSLVQSFNEILKAHLQHYQNPPTFSKTIRVNLISNGNSHKISEEFQKNFNNCTCDGKDAEYAYWTIRTCDFKKITEFETNIHERFDSCLSGLISSTINYEFDSTFKHVWNANEKHIKNAIEDIVKCLDNYGPENIFLSFNGGKDCTVLLHLVLTVLRHKYPNYKRNLACLYVQSSDPFPEQDEFILQAQIYYNLDVTTIRCDIKQALEESLIKSPNYKACFMGSRRTDPYCTDLDVFQMTDANWPEIMRVSPLLDWNYSDIWDYLLFFKIPYCKLYDMGYTSLGNVTNTLPNPSLKYFNLKEEKEMYLPAYKLLKDERERSGRQQQQKMK